MTDIDLLLDAIRDVNVDLFPLPVPVFLHAAAIGLVLLVFFARGRWWAWVDRVAKLWLGLSQILVVVFMLRVAHILSQHGVAHLFVLYIGAVPYAALGVLFLADIWLQRVRFATGIPSLRRSLGLTVALGGTLLYPITQTLAGHHYPRLVVYGAEVPTVTYVIGLLIMGLSGAPAVFKVFLAVLSLVGILAGGAASVLGYWNDVYFMVAGVVGLVYLATEVRSHRRASSAPPVAS